MIDLSISDEILIKNPIDAFIQEIDILFNTTKTELIGNVEFGSSFVDYLWEMKYTEVEVMKYATDLVSEYCYYANRFNYRFDCEIIDGEYRDIYLLQLTIGSDDDTVTKIYQFR